MMFTMGKSNAKVYVTSAAGIKFTNVAGEDEAKKNLAEIVNCLHDLTKYKKVGASMPKGVLLAGLPGAGKTIGEPSGWNLAKQTELRDTIPNPIP